MEYKGLSSNEVLEKQKKYGKNVLTKVKKEPMIKKF